MAYVVIAFLIFCVCLPLIAQNQNVWGNPIIELVEKKESESENRNVCDDHYKFDDFVGSNPNAISHSSTKQAMPDIIREFHLLFHPDIVTPPPKEV
jgi:hypothetical protein